MRKIFLILCIILVTLSFTGCKNKEEKMLQEPTVVATYEETPLEKIEEYLENEIECITTTYYQMSDGTWRTEDHSYQYRLEISGRMNAAVKDTTYIILSNATDITFDQAWKASGLSSSMSDYFDPENAKIVGMISKETITAEQ